VKETNILTTKELAKYLKLNEKTVIKMAQSKELPGFKIGNQWRFYLSVIDEYLQDKIIKSPEDSLNSFIKATGEVIPLSRLVDESRINLSLKSRNKDGVLYELAETAYRNGVAISIDNLSIQLKKREQMLSTAIGKGIAIPHPRNPSDELFKKASIIIGLSKKGVDFDAPDKHKVKLFFMTCAPDVVFHLNLLSKIAKLIEDEAIIKKIMIARNKSDIVKLLLESERMAYVLAGNK